VHIFRNLNQKLKLFNENLKNSQFKILKQNPEHLPFVFYDLFSTSDSWHKGKIHLIIEKDLVTAENTYSLLKAHYNGQVLFYPGFENSPYLDVISSEKNLLKRISILLEIDNFSDNEIPFLIITTIDAAILKMPTPKIFNNLAFDIKAEDIFAPEDLSKRLVSIGFEHANTVEEPGTFSFRGEIFDIYPLNHGPIRIHYYDELIEKIFLIDQESQKTIKGSEQKNTLKIFPSFNFVTNKEFSDHFKTSVYKPSPGEKNKHELRKKIFNDLNNDILFREFVNYYSLFFKEKTSLLEILFNRNCFIYLVDNFYLDQNYYLLKDILNDDFNESQTDLSYNLLPSPESIFSFDSYTKLNEYKTIRIESGEIELENENDQSFLNSNIQKSLPLKIYLKKILLNNIYNENIDFKNALTQHTIFTKFLFTYLYRCLESQSFDIVITYVSSFAKKEILYLCENYEIPEHLVNKINFINFNLKEGFFDELNNTLIISDRDVFGQKKSSQKAKKNKKNIDLFAEQISTLKENDFVIHNLYGVGKYLGIETLSTSNTKNDFLVIQYKNKDKVYVPVYKTNLIQKYSSSETKVVLDDLNSQKFNTAKSKAKKAVKELAFSLIKLQAQREESKAFKFSPPDSDFKDFELAFPFQETPDQINAINDVIDDLQKEKPMDRLICGDVGFGKTEIAMRASMKAVLESKQVILLVPTTILALQHYHSFLTRFKSFPVNIEFVSRLKTAKQTKEVFDKFSNGNIDILIGTHKILSKNLIPSDLGLVIVDEEQRFGVSHKEQFKLLKNNIHFLTLTATPIPRTLQLSFLGLRDLSLIQSAPPRRQSIKTYLIRENDKTIKHAIEKEMSRGGQVFFVHNRVNDIEIIYTYLKRLVPKAKIAVAHGQMKEKELENKITQFYKHQYDILLATTIIESGIDIPNANTMIINKANNFGLSQLHQLRGRIGRSDRKAYAYFIIPDENKISETAHKRLKSLQMYAEVGAGFAIASSDLEIRGAGDILGGTQSGHMAKIGLELYMELLKEAIAQIKGEKLLTKTEIEFKFSFYFNAFIPDSYISDTGQRLKYYKKISNQIVNQNLLDIKEELFDIYGHIPEETINLFFLMELKILLSYRGIKSLSTKKNQIILKFDQSILSSNPNLQSSIFNYFMKDGKKYKINPDFSVICYQNDTASKDIVYKYAKIIAEQIQPC
jgi:transcription-repair coupling factor (superfamily II helicase)